MSDGRQKLFDGTMNFLLKRAFSKDVLKQLISISSKELLIWRIIMCDIITDSIGVQTSVGRKFRPIYNFKLMSFFPYVQLYSTPSYMEVI